MNVVLAYLYMDFINNSYRIFCLNDYPRSDLLRLSEYLNNRFDWKTAEAKLLKNEDDS